MINTFEKGSNKFLYSGEPVASAERIFEPIEIAHFLSCRVELITQSNWKCKKFKSTLSRNISKMSRWFSVNNINDADVDTEISISVTAK